MSEMAFDSGVTVESRLNSENSNATSHTSTE